MILYFGLIFACNKPAVTPQVSPDTTPPPVQTETEKAKPPIAQKNITEQLLTTGLLDPVPAETESPLTVQFRSMYRNGCWVQSKVETSISQKEITHQYEATYEGEGKMCTMALVPGGFTETMNLDPGVYNGKVIVNGEVKATYSVTITP